VPDETCAMGCRFPVFEVVVKRRGRKWRWCVSTTEGKTVMLGSEGSRVAAAYEANRALFLLLLSAPYRLQISARLA
jgi:hypothetical protein